MTKLKPLSLVGIIVLLYMLIPANVFSNYFLNNLIDEENGEFTTQLFSDEQILVPVETNGLNPGYDPYCIIFKRPDSVTSVNTLETDTTQDIPQSLKDLGVSTIKTVFDRVSLADLASSFPDMIDNERLVGLRNRLQSIFVAELPEGLCVENVLSRISTDTTIEWAEPCYYRAPLEIPNDPYYVNQPYYSLIRAENAWDITTGSPDVVIAVIDTGVDYTHPDLADNIWTNPGEIPDDGIDNDNNGFVDDVHGWDFVRARESQVHETDDPGPPDNDPMDVRGHGTCVAGAFGAVGNNGIGVAGVNWDVSIMPLRAGYKTASGGAWVAVTAIAEALLYAADNGADIVNMSFGNYAYSRLEQVMFDYCAEAGVILIAGAGNDDSNTILYPAGCENVFAVAALNQTEAVKASYSSFGINIDACVPSNIYTTEIGGDFRYAGGTSLASPVVAGIAGLIKATHPDWGYESVFLNLRSTALGINDLNPHHFGMLGAGLIDAYLAVQATEPTVNIGVIKLFELQDYGAGHQVELIPSLRNFSLDENAVIVSLASTDDYVTVTDGESSIGDMGNNRIVSGESDTFSITISNETPANHWAEFYVDVSSAGSGLITTETLPLNINPQMSPRLSVADRSGYLFDYMPDQVLELPGGGAVVLFRSQRVSNVYAAVLDEMGGWGTPEKLNDLQSGNAWDQAGTVSDDGRIHVVYQGNMGEWDNELFYTSRNPSNGAWSNPVKLTKDAEIFEPNYGSSPSAIGHDVSGYPHIVYAASNGDAVQFYQIHYDGSKWAEANMIHQFDSDTRPFGVKLLFDSSGDEYLFWSEVKRSPYNPDYWPLSYTYMMKLTDNIPQSIHQVSGSHMFSYEVIIDEFDQIHILYQHAQYYHTYFNKSSMNFSDPVLIKNRNVGARYFLTKTGQGIPVITCIERINGIFDFFDSSYNGNEWSDWLYITSEKTNHENYHDFAMDKNGGRYFIGITYNHEISMSGRTHDIFIQTSKWGQPLLPEKPTIDTCEFKTISEKNILTAEWRSTDSDSIDSYEYAVGRVPGGTDHIVWTNIGHIGSLNMDMDKRPYNPEQEYYLGVRARKGIYRSPVSISKITPYDRCPDDPDKLSPGICGCNIPEIDTDADGIMDCVDDCLNTPLGETVDEKGCSIQSPKTGCGAAPIRQHKDRSGRDALIKASLPLWPSIFALIIWLGVHWLKRRVYF